MSKQIIILAGGVGSRMGGEIPKVLIPLSGRPMILYLLDQVDKLENFLTPIVVVGYKSTQVQKTLGKKYHYALQRQQLGTANAVWAAHKKVKGSSVIVVYGDMPLITANSLRRIAQSHQSHDAMISMFTCHVPDFTGWHSDFIHFGRIVRDKYNNIIGIKEYVDASDKERKILEVNPGIYMFNTQWLWDNIASISNDNALNQYYLTDIIAIAMEQGHPIDALPIDPREVWGVNTPAQLKQAELLLAAR